MTGAAQWLAAHAIALLMLGVGLSTDRAVIRDLHSRSRLLVRALAVLWIVVPLCALLVIYVAHPSRTGAGVLMVMAICPGVPLALGKSTRAHGDRRTSLLILISTALTAIIFTVVWGAVLTRTGALTVPVSMLDVARVVLPMVLVPFAIGRAIIVLAPRFAPALTRLSRLLFIAGAALLVIGAIRAGAPALRELGARDIIAALLVPNAALAIGYLATPAPRSQRISVAFAAALGNPALAIAVITQAVPDTSARPFTALIVAFVLLRAIALLPATFLLKRSAT
jgi:BASS family bile acid:Na+ symporter